MNEKVARSFRQLYLAKRTGVLICDDESGKRSIFFRSGFVVGARSSRPEHRLGEFLIRKGVITKQHFQDASHFIKSGWKMGEILAELSIIERDKIEEYVRMQLLEIACSVLIDPPQKLTFSDLSVVDSVVSIPLSVANVLMEAARSTPQIEGFVERLRADKRNLGFSSDALLRFQDVHLSPEEAYILSRIDGSENAREIFSLSPLSEEKTARILLGLLQAGIIEPEGEAGRRGEAPVAEGSGEPKPETPSSHVHDRREIERVFQELQRKNHWEVLDVERGASLDALKASFQSKAKRFHPDRFRRLSEPDAQEKINFIFCRIREAYDTLSTQAKAEEYKKLEEKESQYEEKQKTWTPPSGAAQAKGPDRRRPPEESEALFARAKKAFAAEDSWTAIQLCQQAIEIVSDKAQYYHLLGMAQAKNPKWRQDAERSLKIATNLDPWKGEYFAALGRLYKNAGLTLRAQRMFDQARAVDPSFAMKDMEEK